MLFRSAPAATRRNRFPKMVCAGVSQQHSPAHPPYRSDPTRFAPKTGLYGLIRALALELGPYNVRANLIAVGRIDTKRVNPEWYPEGNGMPGGFVGDKADGTTTGRDQGSPLGRVGVASEVANVALFLASDESSYVTGDRIVCAGGRYM